jgi:hypothetical protein
MFLIICAENEEARHIRCNNAVILVTGAGVSNILKCPKITYDPNDIVINVGYAGSNVFDKGTVASVKSVQKLNQSIINEPVLGLEPLYLEGVDCHTADDFVKYADKELPLVDMELYYLRLLYPQIQSLKIVSDNFNYGEYKEANFKKSWDVVNDCLNMAVQNGR